MVLTGFELLEIATGKHGTPLLNQKPSPVIPFRLSF
jgi:hypothetical protein